MLKPVFYVLLFITCFISASSFAQVPAQHIVPFSFYDVHGKAFTNKDITKDKFTFFLFLDPGCEHCQKAIANYSNNYDAFKQTNILIVSESSIAVTQSFLQQYAPVLLHKQNVVILQDKQNTFVNTFQPIRYPGMFLYDKAGKLILYEDNEETIFRFVNFLNKAEKKQ